MYKEAETDCWKCHETITVYTWDGHTLWDTVLPTRDGSHPVGLELRTSYVVDVPYWANTCVHCGSVQGDWYLYEEPGGPFYWGRQA